ncbi:hypothetical protein TNIN_313301, partial [Trichonephila inaurata madagascariensis]
MLVREVTEIIGSHHDKLLGGPGYGKEGLQLRKLEVPTVESEGISDMMPKTFNKNLLNGSQPSSNPDIHHYVEF